MLLQENGISYAVQIEEFVDRGLFTSNRNNGVAFYVLSSQRDFCRDLFVTNGGFFYTGKNFFYKNDGNQSKWISIQCKGTISNSSAIGATVHVKATIFGRPVWQMQQISGQTGFLGQNSLDAEFGLGDATAIDSLVIKWPSGTV